MNDDSPSPSESRPREPNDAADTVLGLHHVTAIAGDPHENLAFYRDTLSLRLVKKSVNQDDPTTYHLFYADGGAHPGSDITFFPWRHMAPARPGIGLTSEVMLAVPGGTLPYWQERLEAEGVAVEDSITRFGERTLTLRDPHGLALALVETDDPRDFSGFSPWRDGPVPADRQIRGLHGVRMLERDLEPTAAFLKDVLAFEEAGEEGGWHRYALPGGGGSGRFLDLRALPDARRGQWGTGSVHHVAWAVRDDDHEGALRRRLAAAGRRPTEPIDRFWFRSVYFMEPGGVLFELATMGPGFAVDEAPERLGERLILPPWLEGQRAAISAALPPLDTSSRTPGPARAEG